VEEREKCQIKKPVERGIQIIQASETSKGHTEAKGRKTDVRGAMERVPHGDDSPSIEKTANV
jgi:hypothetical protein